MQLHSDHDATPPSGACMPRLSSKRQITLPKAVCDKAGIRQGDQFEILEHNGHITLIRQQAGAPSGFLKHLQTDPDVSETESRDSAIDKRRSTNDRG
ncbi:MAG: AbrB/MazE/SpoVT family DNA-binding domain-containing protein [Pseudohongiellaceae bacterium]